MVALVSLVPVLVFECEGTNIKGETFYCVAVPDWCIRCSRTLVITDAAQGQ